MIFPKSSIDDFVRRKAGSNLADDYASSRLSIIIQRYIESTLMRLPTIAGQVDSNEQPGGEVTEDFLMEDLEESSQGLHLSSQEIFQFIAR